MIEVDVAIVGGGPAGCSTALALTQQGLSAAIISASTRNDKPTETASPALAHILRALNSVEALKACEPCYGICSTWGRSGPALRPSIIEPNGHAWFVHRGRFDACLQQSARNSGVIWLEAIARSIHFDPLEVLVSTTGDSVRAKWLVLATGSPVWPARITKQKVVNRDSLIALWGRLPFSPKERLLFVESTDFGWWYLCPDDCDGAIACLITDAGSSRELGSARSLNWSNLFNATVISQQLSSEISVGMVFAATTGLISLPNTFGYRWIAVGDAAAKLDPLGSSGTVTALDAGRRSAAAIAEIIRGNLAGLERYQQWASRLVEEFCRQRRQQYLLEQRNRGGNFWDRRVSIPRRRREFFP